MDIVSSPIFFILVVSTTAVQSDILMGPTNALRKVGDIVTLECVTSSSNCDEVEWTKMEGAQSPKTVFRDGTILNGFRDGRYNVSSKLTVGCNLTIRRLEIGDSGRFTCEQTIGATQDSKGSVLVVINVKEACLSNVTSNALNQNDVYSFRTAINVPAKSLEPTVVFLLFPNKTETEAMDDKQPLIIKTTLTGIARRENITPRVCSVSFAPNTVPDFDRTVVFLDVCTTQQLIVSHPVEKIAVSPSSPYHKGDTVRCTTDGYPSPTFKWTNLKSGVVLDGDTLEIDGEAGDEYTCTATNTFKGKPTSLNITIEVSPPESSCGTGCIIGIVCGGAAFIVAIVVISVSVYKRGN